jgi:hypothetical protein
MEPITDFRGEYGWLSNFYRHPVAVPGWGRVCLTAEHAYQAAKARTWEQAQWVADAPTPQLAKSRGRQVELSDGWEARKRAVMLKILLAKFTRNWDNKLAQRLVATGDAVLVEGNTWGDTFWVAVRPGLRGFSPDLPAWRFGVKGPLDCGDDLLAGHNWLGRELMMVREVLT